MKLKKAKLVGIIGIITITVQMLFIPTIVKAADSAHYELKMWKMGVRGDSASINFGYIGSDGTSLVSTLPIEPSLVAGHSSDPSWTQYDSAAPLLAYIKKYGIDNNIEESMNPTCFDPSIFQSLAAQGINLSQLGGPNVPAGSTPPANLVGKANYGSNIGKVLVGVGVPAPDFSSIGKSVSSATTEKKVAAVSNPTPPAQAAAPAAKSGTSSSAATATSKQATSTPKVGTNLNSVPQTQETAVASKADPKRTDPPVMALNDKTQTKIKSSAENTDESAKTPWPTYAGIIGSGILVIGFIVFVKFKYLKA
ncbi:hypothetical protein [Desulfosporosinus sp. FKA]|uniref:hypothetical protein n=1 Tax=Desulfosporosinus sp. FKA TaxID=1969834 RepID=UPI000B4A27C6|nr:hypothetical protein [Desulfosporosinus sp. FKA]